MDGQPAPTKTPMGLEWLEAPDPDGDRIKRALFSSIDGHRNVIALGSFARAMGFEPEALERLRGEGLIGLPN